MIQTGSVTQDKCKIIKKLYFIRLKIIRFLQQNSMFFLTNKIFCDWFILKIKELMDLL